MSKPCDGTPSGKINGLLAKNPVAILIHVTDTYFIEESRVNGITDLPGFARFCSLTGSIRTNPTVQKNKIPVLVLHGGDFLYPSLMSIYFHGRQMVDVMNMCRFDYCTLGNHDFDGGIDSLKERTSEASFEITCANIKNPEKEDILKISDYVICYDENNKPYAAITGVAGKATLRKAEQNGFATTDTDSSLSQTITNIKNNHPQINHLIILSHMGNEEDIKLERWLGRNWDGFLYLLGGHDHNEVMQYSSKSPKAILLKGQSNCRTVQVVGIPKYFDLKNSRQNPEHVVVINSAELSEFHPDSKMQECVKRWETKLEEYLNERKSDRVVKRFKKSIVLDATELQLRKGSTNFGNFIADCILDFAESDIAFINSGHFRGDRKIGSILRLSDLNAQRLFVRLISRKGPHFRAAKVNYAEIDVPAAVDELARAGFLALDAPEYAQDYFDLLSRPELEAFVRDRPDSFAELGALSAYRKPELTQQIKTMTDPDECPDLLSGFGPFYTPLHGEILIVYRLLFFGNLSQDLTEFVLLDLGLIRYESYPIGKDDRIFKSRQIVTDALAYLAAREMIAKAIEADDPETVLAVIAGLPEPGLIRRRDRLFCHAGRYLERKAMLDQAIRCYECAAAPPARERLARIYDRLEDHDRAYDICALIIASPRDPMEKMFAERFQVKLKKRLGLAYAPVIRKKHPESRIILERDPEKRIEQTVLAYFETIEVPGFYAENRFWRGLFGLAFWDIIFMPIKGAFFNFYQRGPKGLFSPRFREDRRAPIETRLAEIRGNPDWPERLLQTYDLKFGIANTLVAWSFLPKTQIERVLTAFSRSHLADIFDRLSQDIGVFKTGFPDLILFPGDGTSCELVEVKGPADQLQPNQHRWLRFFSEKKIPYRIIKIGWKPADKDPEDEA